MAEQEPRFNIKNFERFLGQLIIDLYHKHFGLSLEKRFSSEKSKRGILEIIFPDDYRKEHLALFSEYEPVVANSL